MQDTPHSTLSHAAPHNPTVSRATPRDAAICRNTPLDPTDLHHTSQLSTESHNPPHNPIDSHNAPSNTILSHKAPRNTTDSPQPPLSTRVRAPRPRLHLEDLFPPLSAPPHRRRWAMGVAIAVVTVGVFFLLREAGWIQSPTGGRGGPGGHSAQIQESETDSHAGNKDIPSTRQTEAESTEADGADEVTEAPTECDTAPAVETSDEATSETADSAESDDPIPDGAQPPLPTGCIGFVSVDKSESAKGAEYIQSGDMYLPEVLPSDSPWSSATPTILIVNTQPYEGYGGGTPWYDPASGGLALTDSPNAPDGVVALGAELAATLRAEGMTVIHLRLAVESGETASSVYERTEEAIRYYRRLYPDIGLVIDLRRSAELTADGSILATQGNYGGRSCAQLRISVNSGREGGASDYDLAVATALRRNLWDTEPTLCRPVRVKGGEGLIGDLGDLRVLTLEMGSAGNTYEDACVLVDPLSDAIRGVVKKYS